MVISMTMWKMVKKNNVLKKSIGTDLHVPTILKLIIEFDLTMVVIFMTTQNHDLKFKINNYHW